MLAIILTARILGWEMGVAGAAVDFLALVFPSEPLIPLATGVAGLSLVTTGEEGEPQNWFNESRGFA